jgi:hypothetical protein
MLSTILTAGVLYPAITPAAHRDLHRGRRS